MKILISLFAGVGLTLVLLHLDSSVFGDGESGHSLAALHGNVTQADSQSEMSAAMQLMQTETALCDQPYFREVYELEVEYFSRDASEITAEGNAELLFEHARTSGHFTAEEAEGWIAHIKDIPAQLVDIYLEDSTVLDSCYNFQVAGVGPPQGAPMDFD